MPNIQFGKIPIFPNYSIVGGCPKRQKALKTLRFLYGSSSIHWPPKPILSFPISSHLFPFNFFPISPSQSSYTLHIYFLILLPSPIFLLLTNFYHPQFHTIRKKIFLLASQNPKNPLSSPIFPPTYFKFK